MHFCSQMSGFMDGGELWRVIERQFDGELTFNGGRVRPRPHDLPLLNYLARCRFSCPILSAQKVEILKRLSFQATLSQPLWKCITYKKKIYSRSTFGYVEWSGSLLSTRPEEHEMQVRIRPATVAYSHYVIRHFTQQIYKLS